MEVVGNDSASAYVLCPFDLCSSQFQKSEFRLKSDERERELKSSGDEPPESGMVIHHIL